MLSLAACGGDQPRLDIAPGPATYRITYRVEGATTSTEIVTVSRPFAGSVDAAGTVRATELGVIAVGEQVLAHPPGDTTADVRVDAVLADAEEAGLIERRGTKEVLDRRCQVLRSGRSLREGALTPPTEDTYSDTCVDESGLLLEEVLVVDGARDLRRVATEVEVGVDAGPFVTDEQTVPADQGGGSVVLLDGTVDVPATAYELPSAPVGFRNLARYAVVPPRGQDPILGGEGRAAIADVYVDGIDLLVIEQGGTLLGTEPFPEPAANSSPVDLGAVGRGVAVLGAQRNEVRVDLGDGQYVRVIGTLPIDELTAVARDLRPR